jgi:integrase
MFAVLYGLGLRAGEVSRLRAGDVDLSRQLLVIRDTKFSKSRLVPVGPRIGQLLEGYLAQRAQHYGALVSEAVIFSFDGSKAISLSAMGQTLHLLCAELKLPIPAGSIEAAGSRPAPLIRSRHAAALVSGGYRSRLPPAPSFHLSRPRGPRLDRGLSDHHSGTPRAGESAV